MQPGAAQHGEQQLRAVRRAPTFSAATLACSRSFLSCSSAAFAARSATVYCLFFAPFGRPMATHSPWPRTVQLALFAATRGQRGPGAAAWGTRDC